ncbi:transglycosylase SLT domain-containing protein [Ketobacter sp. MCCC 1A13808]|nr:transglycosylase SLT domain-containing protein [Ketobacter sp. MCCC 1A13808]
MVVYYLTLLSGGQTGLRKKMSVDEPARWLIGQGTQCDWVLNEVGVQPLHCLVETTCDAITVVALLGQIAVNDEAIDHHNPVSLKPGDHIKLGESKVRLALSVATDNSTQVKIQVKVQGHPANNVPGILPGKGFDNLDQPIKSKRRHSLQANSPSKRRRLPIRLPVFGAGLILVGASCYALVGNSGFSDGQSVPQQLTGMVSASWPSSLSDEVLSYIPERFASNTDAAQIQSAPRLTLQQAFEQSGLRVPGNRVGEASLMVFTRLGEVQADSAEHRETANAIQSGKLIHPIVAFKMGEKSYLTDKKGAVYFVNTRLPDGGRLVGIDKRYYTVENESGLYRYSTEHLKVLKDQEQVVATDLKLAQRPLHFRGNVSSKYDHFIRKASETYGVEAPLIKAVIQTESRFDPLAVSHVGAQGLMQIMPVTAKGLELSNPFSPEHNIMAGSKLLGRLLKKYEQNLDLALAAYNAGEGAVRKYNGVPPYKETMEYVVKVNLALDQYRGLVKAANTVAGN